MLLSSILVLTIWKSSHRLLTLLLLVILILYFQPEWFFTQILNWLRDHEDFLDSTIQPIMDKAESSWISAQVLTI